MKEFKGTPGPWEYKKIHGENQLIVKGILEKLGPGMVSYQHVDTDSKANQRLIAAAPELLEALQETLPWVNSGLSRQTHAKALAAISKALGEK